MVSTSAPTRGQWTISHGDVVCTADGHRLGEVVQTNADELVVENGLIFRRRYMLARHELDRYEHGVLITSLTLAEAQERERR